MKPSICIDAGHGGKDPGAVGRGGLREKDVALNVAMLLGKSLTNAGVQCFYTRMDDRFLELKDRAEKANSLGADLFLSIHCNSAASPARGFEVFTSSGQTAADPFATELFKAYARTFPLLPKRIDDKDGDPDKEASFAVLRHSRMPSALFELDFISHPEGETFLRDAGVQVMMADALADGVLAHLKLAPAAAAPTAAGAIPKRDELLELAAQLVTLAKRLPA